MALGWRDLAEMEAERFRRESEKLGELIEERIFLSKEDSIIRANIINRENPETIYLYKAFVRATITCNRNRDDNFNILDTVQVLFNNNMEILTPRDFQDF